MKVPNGVMLLDGTCEEIGTDIHAKVVTIDSNLLSTGQVITGIRNDIGASGQPKTIYQLLANLDNILTTLQNIHSIVSSNATETTLSLVSTKLDELFSIDDRLALIKTNTDVLNSMNTKLAEINSDTDNIAITNSKLDNTNSKLDTSNTHLNNIKNGIDTIVLDLPNSARETSLVTLNNTASNQLSVLNNIKSQSDYIDDIYTGIDKIGDDTGLISSKLDDVNLKLDTVNSNLSNIDGKVATQNTLIQVWNSTKNIDLKIDTTLSTRATESTLVNVYNRLNEIENVYGIRKIVDPIKSYQIFDEEIFSTTYDDTATEGDTIGAVNNTGHYIEITVNSDNGNVFVGRYDNNGVLQKSSTYNLSKQRSMFEVREILIRNSFTGDGSRVAIHLYKYARQTSTAYGFKPYRRYLAFNLLDDEDLVIVETLPFTHYNKFRLRISNEENKTNNWAVQLVIASRD